MLSETPLDSFLPSFDTREQRLVDEIKKEGGDIFRDELRRKVGGSNTTFMRKVMDLKKKGVIEEYKRSNGRLKTAYRLTVHAQRIFNVADILRMEKWFSASQKIELFPEFEPIAEVLTGSDGDVYKMLEMEPQHVSIEISLAASESPSLKEAEVREVLSMCNAILQKIVTSKLHPRFEERVEGYILFHYSLEKPKEELQRVLPQCILDYVKASDPLEQHKACSKLVELAIKHPSVLPMVTMTAMKIAKVLALKQEEKELLENYRSYKDDEEPQQLNRIRTAVSALKIFEVSYVRASRAYQK